MSLILQENVHHPTGYKFSWSNNVVVSQTQIVLRSCSSLYQFLDHTELPSSPYGSVTLYDSRIWFKLGLVLNCDSNSHYSTSGSFYLSFTAQWFCMILLYHKIKWVSKCFGLLVQFQHSETSMTLLQGCNTDPFFFQRRV